MSQFNKCSYIHPNLRKFNLKQIQNRARTKTPIMRESLENPNILINSSKNFLKIEEDSIKVGEHSIVDVKQHDKETVINETEQTTPSSNHSAIIDSAEKKKAVNYGYSLDKRIDRCVPIYDDLQMTSYGLAQAVLRHIKFSRGMLFIDDLAQKMRRKESIENTLKKSNNISNKIELSPSCTTLRYNYCFKDKLRFELSGARPKYLFTKAETIESIKKELTFEPKAYNPDKDTYSSNNNVIKLNLSDSEDDSEPVGDKHIPLIRTFTFNDIDNNDNDHDSQIRSVIHEEHDEFNDSRLLTGTNEGSPSKHLRLQCNSKLSQSIASNNSEGLFKLNLMGCNETNPHDPLNDEINLFKIHQVKESEHSSGTFSNRHAKLSSEGSPSKVVPCSPTRKMRGKRRQRACQIANNPCMLIDNDN